MRIVMPDGVELPVELVYVGRMSDPPGPPLVVWESAIVYGLDIGHALEAGRASFLCDELPAHTTVRLRFA